MVTAIGTTNPGIYALRTYWGEVDTCSDSQVLNKKGLFPNTSNSFTFEVSSDTGCGGYGTCVNQGAITFLCVQ